MHTRCPRCQLDFDAPSPWVQCPRCGTPFSVGHAPAQQPPQYPQPLTTLAYYFGINYLLYAMTH